MLRTLRRIVSTVALIDEFDTFQGNNNPKECGMPQRWFVVYANGSASSQ